MYIVQSNKNLLFMKRILLLFSVAFMVASSAMAQKNVVKLSATNLLMNTATLTYERTFLRQFSANISGGMVMERNVPAMFVQSNGVGAIFSKAEDKFVKLGASLKGFNFTPEVRMYLSLKGSPKGLYLAPFFRHNNYTVDFEPEIHMDGADEKEFNVTGRFVTNGFGVQMGTQFVFAKHFAVDIYAVTLGFNKGTASLEYTSVDNWEIQDSESLQENIKIASEKLPFVGKKIDVEVKDDGVKATLPYSMIAYRIGISVGFAF